MGPSASSHVAPNICHWGLSYKHTPIAERESAYFSEAELIQGLQRLVAQPEFTEAMIVQTCHRFEVWVVLAQPLTRRTITVASLRLALFGREGDPATPGQSWVDAAAVAHLMKVVASLDSMVLGETQITHQFKQAMRRAELAGSMGRVLTRLAAVALHVAKKVRRETGLGYGVTSLAHAAVQLADRVYAKLSHCHVVILGAGQMAALCAAYAAKAKVKQLSILNRSVRRAQDLAQQYGQAQGGQLEHLPELLTRADMILSCVETPAYLLTRAQLEPLMKQRRKLNKPYLLICDLAMPRSMDPTLAELDEIYLFDIDDLTHATTHNRQHKQQAATTAQGYIEAGAAEFMAWLHRHPKEHPLGELQASLHHLLTTEMQRTLAKSCFGDEHAPHLQQLARSMGQKITAAMAKCLSSDLSVPQIQLSELSTQLSQSTANQRTRRRAQVSPPHPPQHSAYPPSA